MDVESWYGKTVKFGTHEFLIDEDGFVTCNGVWSLGHLESCLEIWDVIANLVEATSNIDLSDTLLQQSIF